MFLTRLVRFSVLGIVILITYFLGARAQAITVTGAGSGFAAPIYEAWSAASEKKTGVAVNYQNVGSSAGENQVLVGTVDFGASDIPMKTEQLELNKMFQFPTVMGGVVPVVNLAGIKADELVLSGDIIADIYMGTITMWDDARIKALNPHIVLPHQEIAPIYRADGSGTTFVFTSYLAESSARWKQKQGVGASVGWPCGMGARGNDGVAAAIQNVDGAIGYIEYAYARHNHLTTIQLRNRFGINVVASLKSFSDAVKYADWKAATHFVIDVLKTSGKNAWPIVSATYVLVPLPMRDRQRDIAVQKFFEWGFKNGDRIVSNLDYVALPKTLKKNIIESWKRGE
ncbi:MAG: phosphate ABC transporter substrate-binding protein PstS [Acetobacter sp.]|nr:phosphate ABC transporter substrate-binding protein PstS [Acetobacter sp.]MBQ3818267.1 phosphate ABC transporter substrate-binding protein PstS [Acetobacter sp.]MBQ5469049.1 phosphate ABC transporter substrate-binding protein PstS [Acetobacter sp.]MBQ5479564.1 phosphate ABC transporter substrate-binding protein PstS [Acetobacter sp.]MBQ5515603.1 phosphate ABC transporter substrate-binding protein PstS [Acetobacter sp.]